MLNNKKRNNENASLLKNIFDCIEVLINSKQYNNMQKFVMTKQFKWKFESINYKRGFITVLKEILCK